MILTARRVSAAEGKELGFVNEVVPPGELMAARAAVGGADHRMQPDADPRLQGGDQQGLEAATLEQAIAEQMRYPAVAALLRSRISSRGRWRSRRSGPRTGGAIGHGPL